MVTVLTSKQLIQNPHTNDLYEKKYQAARRNIRTPQKAEIPNPAS